MFDRYRNNQFTKDEIKQLFYETFGFNDSTTQLGEDIAVWCMKYQFRGMLEAMKWYKETGISDFYTMIDKLNMPL